MKLKTVKCTDCEQTETLAIHPTEIPKLRCWSCGAGGSMKLYNR